MSDDMKEPWYVFSHYGDPEIRTKDGDKLVAVLLPSKLQTARRIVACVNACAGVPQDWLETGTQGGVQNVRDERDQYKRRSEDLMAACRRAILALAAASEKDHAFSADYEAVSAAIEEATK